MRNATRVLASTIGVICGISGLEHGFFEMLYLMIGLLPLVIISALAHDSLETFGFNPEAAK